jgi:hypothetical protein
VKSLNYYRKNNFVQMRRECPMLMFENVSKCYNRKHEYEHDVVTVDLLK